MKDEVRSAILNRIESLEDEKRPRLNVMKELGAYLAPYRNIEPDFKDTYEQYSDIGFEDRPIDSKKKMRDGIFGYTCNPQSTWFEQDAMDADHDTKKTLRENDRELYKMLREGRFYKQAHMFIDDAVTFGTAAMLTRKRGEKVLYKAINPFRFVFDQDEDGDMLFFTYFYYLTAVQLIALIQKLGQAVPKKLADAARGTGSDPFKCYYIVAERETSAYWKKVKTKNEMPYAEYLIVEGLDDFSYEGGFSSNPVAIWKFYETTGNTWGYSPGDDALRDVIYVNRISEYYMDGTELRATPPMKAPMQMKEMDFEYAPREVLWTMNAEIDAGFMNPGGDMISTENVINRKLETIGYAFMQDFWTMLSRSTKRKTAYEVTAEESEKLALISAPIESLIDALVDILNRTRDIGIEMKRIKEVGGDVKYTFNGTLAQAQRRLTEGQGTMRAMQEISPFLIGPEQLDVINLDSFIRSRMKVNNADPSTYRTEQETAKIRKDRAKMMEEQEQKQMALEAGKASSNAKYEDIAQNIGGLL